MESKKSLPISLYAYKRNGKPTIDLRVRINDRDIIKGVITAALTDKPIIVYPVLRYKVLALGRFIELGILKKDEKDGKYVFDMK